MDSARQAREIAIEALDLYLVGKRPEDLAGALRQIIYVLRDGNIGGGDR
jgi:hypothetical protein